MVPIGEDRLSIITGHRKMFDLRMVILSGQGKSICTHRYKGRYCSLMKWASDLSSFYCLVTYFFPKGDEAEPNEAGLAFTRTSSRNVTSYGIEPFGDDHTL